ncbi:anti-sigma regulatory factor (Ser/Thr protein kinase) [Streptomyces sp. SLBN-118]|nr:anti-sigma regulatory factor (Ser/Thr protein kinase) [Streptomyces sp. SLBN-118]
MSTLLVTPDTGTPGRTTSRSRRGQLDMTLNMEAELLAGVRRIVREHLRWWRVDAEASDRLLSAVNELLTNVLDHTARDDNGFRMASLLVQQVPDGVTAIVRDNDPRPPVPVAANPLAECGRGLALVRALVDESSVSTTDAGKDVWIFVSDLGSTERR